MNAFFVNKRKRNPKRVIKNVESRDSQTIELKTQNEDQNKQKQQQQKTTHTAHKTKRTGNKDPTENRGFIQVLTKSKHFLIFIRHPPCYSRLSAVKVLLVIEEINHL